MNTQEYNQTYYQANKERIRSEMKTRRADPEHREHINKLQRESHARNKASVKNQHLKDNFGISLEEYHKIFQAQNGKCAICKKHQSELKRALAVDHDHETGQVRGLLCANCNLALGHLKDDPGLLCNAIKYLGSGANTQ